MEMKYWLNGEDIAIGPELYLKLVYISINLLKKVQSNTPLWPLPLHSRGATDASTGASTTAIAQRGARTVVERGQEVLNSARSVGLEWFWSVLHLKEEVDTEE